MSPLEAIRSATIHGAIYLGMEDEIGSLKPGKLADFIVIDGNPLKNIYDTEKVQYTVLNGRVYDAEYMNEVGHRPKSRQAFFFELPGSGNAWPMISGVKTIFKNACVCRTDN